MDTTLTPTVQALLEYFAETASPEEILGFALSEQEQERVRELLDRAAFGEITPAERAELEQLAVLDEKLSLLKTRARKALIGK